MVALFVTRSLVLTYKAISIIDIKQTIQHPIDLRHDNLLRRVDDVIDPCRPVDDLFDLTLPVGELH